MPKRPKYKAKHVFWDVTNRIVAPDYRIEKYRKKGKLKLPPDIIRFDSQHEFYVYLELCRMYGVGRVARQVKLRIQYPTCCYPNGKHWRVDFGILDEE